MRRLDRLALLGALAVGLLAVVPGLGAGAIASRQGAAQAAAEREDLRQLDHLLSATPESLRAKDGAMLEEYLRRLLLVAERLRQPGALNPAVRESVDQQVLARNAQVVALLRQQRMQRDAGVPSADGPDRGALGVLADFALGLARQPVLLGGLLAGVMLVFLGGVGLGQRRAWQRPPVVSPASSPTIPAAPLPAAVPAPALDVRRARVAVAGGRPLLLSLSYEIKADRRKEYLAYVDRLREHLVQEIGYAYAVWEHDGRPNWFTEMLLCTTWQEFDRLRGPDDSATRRLGQELDQFLKDPAQVQRTSLMGMAPGAGVARAVAEPVARTPDAVTQPDARSVPIPRAPREVPPDALPAEAA